MMKRKMNKTQVAEYVEKALGKKEAVYASLSQSDNPQTIRMADNIEGQIQVLNAVLLALKGNAVFLNILAEL